MLTKNFGKPEFIRIPHVAGGHGGGDKRLKDKLFLPGNTTDQYRQSAGTRDGALSCLVGIAARKSCDSGQPIKIADLTTLIPMVKKS